ncbi:MAG: glycosyltransferase, partial [Acidimicrobiales bacterium]
MHEQLPPLQVVVVAYGDPGALERCLTPLVSSYPVTVIDNSSSTITRGVAERLGAAYDDPGENLGFGTAVNRVLARLSLPDVDVFLVNPDAVVEPDTVEAMRRALHEGPKVACVAPFQRSPGSTKPSPVRWPFPTPAGAWTEAVGLGRLRHRWDYVIASILCMNGAALSEVGGFDEGFFLYAEEADWERRACERGWRVSYLEDVQALHVGAATDSSPERQEIRFHAGMEHYVRKWHGAAGWRIY